MQTSCIYVMNICQDAYIVFSKVVFSKYPVMLVGVLYEKFFVLIITDHGFLNSMMMKEKYERV